VSSPLVQRQPRSHNTLASAATAAIHPSATSRSGRFHVLRGETKGHLFRRAGDHVDKIRSRSEPADIPVEQPTK